MGIEPTALCLGSRGSILNASEHRKISALILRLWAATRLGNPESLDFEPRKTGFRSHWARQR